MNYSIKNLKLLKQGKLKQCVLNLWGSLKTIGLILMLAPFIILAGLIYGEKCDDIYE